LSDQLKRVYEATLHPDELLEDDAGSKGGNGNKRGKEQWTQEKANERALGLLIELQLQNEGVAEFLELVRLLGDKIDAGNEASHSVEDENNQIIHDEE
jgi:hypothetical protein